MPDGRTGTASGIQLHDMQRNNLQLLFTHKTGYGTNGIRRLALSKWFWTRSGDTSSARFRKRNV